MTEFEFCSSNGCGGHALTFHPDVVKFREEAPQGLPGLLFGKTAESTMNFIVQVGAVNAINYLKKGFTMPTDEGTINFINAVGGADAANYLNNGGEVTDDIQYINFINAIGGKQAVNVLKKEDNKNFIKAVGGENAANYLKNGGTVTTDKYDINFIKAVGGGTAGTYFDNLDDTGINVLNNMDEKYGKDPAYASTVNFVNEVGGADAANYLNNGLTLSSDTTNFINRFQQ